MPIHVLKVGLAPEWAGRDVAAPELRAGGARARTESMINLPHWLQRIMPTRDRIRRSTLYRLLGRSLFAPDLWQFSERALAGGLALGAFIACTPTIPFQMALAAVGALYFRVNLPVALAACWLTNPVTAVPFYWVAWKIGQYALGGVPGLADFLQSFAREDTVSVFLLECADLWTGCLILATLAALVAYLLVRLTAKSLFRRRDRRPVVGRGTGGSAVPPRLTAVRRRREHVLN